MILLLVIDMKRKNYFWLMIMFMVMCINVVNVSAAQDCNGIFGTKLLEEIKSVFRTIQIVAPIIFLLMTSLDFAKVVFADNKDGLNKAKNNFLKRAVAVLIIFFAPFIINLILELVNETTAHSCIPAVS